MSLLSKSAKVFARRLSEAADAMKFHERKEWVERWIVARRRLVSDVGIWYHADYAAPGLAQSARMPNVDLERGHKVVQALESLGLLWERDVRKGAPIPLSALLRVHSLAYLESVTEADKLARIFGLEPRHVDVDAILKSQRRAAGGTLRASRWALAGRGRRAFNLGGGFHHAEPEHGAGFCVYNDIAASIRTLRKYGFHQPCAIVDLDFHQGNGNSVAFAKDATVLTYSLHGAVWNDDKGVADVSITLPTGSTDEDYLEALRRTLPPLLRAHKPKLVYYVAGTDVLGTDALGSFSLSEQGVFERDRFVLELTEELGASAVVTLAGGYSQESWKSAGRMVYWALTGSTEPLPKPEGNIRRVFGHIASGLDPYELQFEGDDSFSITEADLMGELEGVPKASRILGYYSVHGVELAFERYGFLEKLRKRGFYDLRFQVDPSDPDRQRISVYASKDQKDYHLLVELLMSRRSVDLPSEMPGEEPLDMLSIEWLLLQDPTRKFSDSRPRLPGQEHPGLGMVRELMEMLYQACLRLELDGIIMHPSRFHIASVAAGQGVFLDPAIEGRFRALAQILGTTDLSAVSGLIDRQMVVRRDGRVFEWEAEDFIAPVSTRLRNYIASAAYRQAQSEAQELAIADGIIRRDTIEADD
tara:strand:- start:36301 stop:38235 length:1935 start_codon:yes stop_codon:yes gene_type:complete